MGLVFTARAFRADGFDMECASGPVTGQGRALFSGPNGPPRQQGLRPAFRRAFALALLALGLAAALAPQGARAQGPGLEDSTQAILVTAATWDSRRAEMRLFERSPGGKWRQAGKAMTAEIGKNGLAWGRGLTAAGGDGPVKREGDGKAPAGVFRLGPAFGYAAEGSRRLKIGYIRLTDSHECVDDSASPRYNTVFDSAGVAEKGWKSSERMLRPDGQYRIGVIVGHNVAPVTPGAGSCIFLHVREAAGAYTSGCTALPLKDMERVAAWLDASKNPVLVQLPAGERAAFAARHATP